MEKITFLALHLGFGGVEKAICNQANILCESYKVEIVSTYKLYDTPPFYLNPRVKVTYLIDDLKPNKEEFFKAFNSKNIPAIFKQTYISLRVLYLRKSRMKKAVRNLSSDIIISTRVLYNKLLTKNRPEDSVIIAQEHVHHNNNEKYIRKITSSVKYMDYFMPVSIELKEFYEDKLDCGKAKCVYIPHNLDFWPENPSSCKSKNLISVGRLSAEKGYLDLIEIFNKITQIHEDWCLHIIGDGDQRPLLEEKIASYNLQDKVILHGYKENKYVKEMLSLSSIYVMTSFEESFGIVLIEAQSFGLPCVAFDSAKGATEIITDSDNGYLVAGRDLKKFENKVRYLIEDEDTRILLGRNGRLNAIQYKENTIANKWIEFFNSIICNKKMQKR